MRKSNSDKWYWITGISLFLVMMCNCGVGYYSLSLFVQPVSQEFGITSGDYAIVYTFYGIGSAIAAILMTRYLKKHSLKSMILIGGIISTAGYLIYAFSVNLYFMYVGGALVGASTIFAGTAAVQLAIARWFSAKRSMVTGIVAAASGIGSAIGSPIIGKLIRTQGWRFTYGVIGILVFATVCVQILFLFHNDPKDIGLPAYGMGDGDRTEIRSGKAKAEDEGGLSIKEVRCSMGFWLFLIGMIAISIVYQVISLYQSSILIERGISAEMAATCLSVFAVIDMCSKASAGIISEKLGFRVVTTYCSVGVIAALIMARFINSAVGAVAFSALLGLWPTMIVLYGVTASIALFGKKYLAEYISTTQITMCCVSLVGMPLVRMLYNAVGSFDRILNIMAAITIGFALIMLYVLAPGRQYSAPEKAEKGRGGAYEKQV